MADSVRLTIQIRDHDNRQRVTVHQDVTLSGLGSAAKKIAERSGQLFKGKEAAEDAKS